MVRRLVFISLVFLFVGCGKGGAPTYSMQVTNISTPDSSSSENSTSSTGNSSSPLFQFWSNSQNQMRLNLVPLSESLTAEVTYDTATGEQCQGHALFNSSQNTLAISVDDGASTCLAMNGTYTISLTENSLALVNGSTTLNFVN